MRDDVLDSLAERERADHDPEGASPDGIGGAENLRFPHPNRRLKLNGRAKSEQTSALDSVLAEIMELPEKWEGAMSVETAKATIAALTGPKRPPAVSSGVEVTRVLLERMA